MTRLGTIPTPLILKPLSTFLAEPAIVSIDIFNVKGQRVKRLVQADLDRGDYHRTWDGRDESHAQQASGLYFYRFTAGSHTETGKMLMMK